MRIELNGRDTHTRVVLSDEPWNRGIERLIVADGREIPFLLNALSGVHFFTGIWPRPADAIDYEPQVSPGELTRLSDKRAVWHQPETPYTHVETHIEYEIVGPGTVEARFETRSHAASYPHGYVGLFWAVIARPGGQRGIHLLFPAGPTPGGAPGARGPAPGAGRSAAESAPPPPPGVGIAMRAADRQPTLGRLRWHYFQGGGDNLSCRSNTVLGPTMPSAARSPGHGSAYFLAESAHRFALPIQIARWQDLYYGLEVDSLDVAFTDVLLGTAIGGPSWDVYWRLRPGEARTVCCRLTVGPWPGWEAIEQRYRSWHGCVDRSFIVERAGDEIRQPLARPVPAVATPDAGLALSKKLFETRGRPLLERLDLLDRCAVGCFGGSSQNAGLDDRLSRDHWWGPYLTFLLRDEEWQRHGERLRQAVAAMPDEVTGACWTGYDGPLPRRTAVWEIGAFLRMLTGFERRPETDREWLPHLTRAGFLGRRWTEQLADAGQGEAFHDPDQYFTERWRHWTAYVPPDIHRALLARSLFRVWNAGPEYNLTRAQAREDRLAFSLCRGRFVDEVLELAFCWNERFVPPFKWRAAQFRRLPICPAPLREGIDRLSETPGVAESLETARTVVTSIKRLMKDLYHLSPTVEEDLSMFAHAMHASIEDAEVRQQTPLEW
jgi:Domain of unknown function (DUF4037)